MADKKVIFTDGQEVHGSDLEKAQEYLLDALKTRFNLISDYGIVDRDSDVRIFARNGADPLELYISSGKAITRAGNIIEVPTTYNSQDGVSFFLQLPENNTDYHFFQPDTDTSLLLGDPLKKNLVFLIYTPRVIDRTLLKNNTYEDSVQEDSFVFFVIPYDATASDIPDWVWGELQDNGVLIGTVTAGSAYDMSTITVDETQDTYPYNRPQFSGIDAYARNKLDDFSFLVQAYPNCYIERRSTAEGVGYGDTYTETFLATDALMDSVEGKWTGISRSYFVKTKHVPKAIVSSSYNNAGTITDWTDKIDLVNRKRIIKFDPEQIAGQPLALDSTLTITYTYYNIFEPYMNKSTNPDSISVLQPLENELAVVEYTPYNSVEEPYSIPDDKAQYPSNYIFFLNKDGELDSKPRVIFHAVDMLQYETEMALNKQPTNPTKLICFVTCFPGTIPGPQGIAFQIAGTNDAGNPISEIVIVKNTSATEEQPGLGNNGGDWVGWYTYSSKTYASVTSCAIIDKDTEGSVSNRYTSFFVLSAEGLNLETDLPNSSVTINSAGDALEETFLDLRDDYIFNSILTGFSKKEKELEVINGVILAQLIAGEYLKKHDVVYVTGGDTAGVGYCYRALAQDSGVKPNVLGIVWNADIPEGEKGWVLIRGIIEDNFWAWEPGVIYLSSREPGQMTQTYPYAIAQTSYDSITVSFNDLTTAMSGYLALNVAGQGFYNTTAPTADPTGEVFTVGVSGSDTATSFANAVNASSSAYISGKIKATASENLVILEGVGGTAFTLGYVEVGDTAVQENMCRINTTSFTMTIGVGEDGGDKTFTDGDTIYIQGASFEYGSSGNWTNPTTLIDAINQAFGGQLTASSATNGILVSSTSTIEVGYSCIGTVDYGTSPIVSTLDTVSPDTSDATAIKYRPVVRCAYALGAKRILFDGPVFSKKFATEIYLADYEDQFKSNQVEGALIELPKFIQATRPAIIMPVLNASPIFDKKSSPTKRMHMWFVENIEGSGLLGVSFAIRAGESMGSWYKESNNKDNPVYGSFNFQIVGNTDGEIVCFENNCLLSKEGDDQNSWGGKKGGMTLKPVDGSGEDVINRDAESYIANPFSSNIPSSSPRGYTLSLSGIAEWCNQTGANGPRDSFAFTGPKSINFGFKDSSAGDSFTVYIANYSENTVVELSIGEKANKKGVQLFTIGYQELSHFGYTGDSIRMLLGRRCGEAFNYDPTYGTEAGLAPVGSSPKTCLSIS